MGLFGKNKFNKLKREEVVEAIVDLEDREAQLEKRMDEAQKQIQDLTEKARVETDRARKIFYVKKINMAKSEVESNIQRAMCLMYNVQLLNRLKDAIDDKDFVANVGKVPLNKLLGDQKGLAEFLNKALNNKIAMEDIMTSADETFTDVASAYEPNQAIYGVKKADDDLLAMFEAESALNDSTEAFDAEKKEALPSV